MSASEIESEITQIAPGAFVRAADPEDVSETCSDPTRPIYLDGYFCAGDLEKIAAVVRKAYET